MILFDISRLLTKWIYYFFQFNFFQQKHLSDAEFLQYVGCTKEEYDKMKPGKREIVKRKAKLFWKKKKFKLVQNCWLWSTKKCFQRRKKYLFAEVDSFCWSANDESFFDDWRRGLGTTNTQTLYTLWVWLIIKIN